VKSGTIETTISATAEPELGERRCPNGHNSAIPPRCPALMLLRAAITLPKSRQTYCSVDTWGLVERTNA